MPGSISGCAASWSADVEGPSCPVRRKCMSRVSLSASGAEVDLAGGNLVLVLIVAVIALVALGMAVLFRSQVLAAGEGTEQMRTIAKAVQEGASAYLTRQFRTLAVF